jgi:hypothetical protein
VEEIRRQKMALHRSKYMEQIKVLKTKFDTFCLRRRDFTDDNCFRYLNELEHSQEVESTTLDKFEREIRKLWRKQSEEVNAKMDTVKHLVAEFRDDMNRNTKIIFDAISRLQNEKNTALQNPVKLE